MNMILRVCTLINSVICVYGDLSKDGFGCSLVGGRFFSISWVCES